MANIKKDSLIGQQFGYLTILEVTQLGQHGGKRQKKVSALCVCGTIKEYYLGNLQSKNHTTSCGCHKLNTAGDAVRTHGLSGRNHLYGIWCAIKRRCYNENAEDYPAYGGKGVAMCDLWKNDYKAFYDWAMSNGWKKGLQVDKDAKAKALGVPALLYSPDMCTVLTCRTNQNSRSDNIMVEFRGEIKTLSQIATEHQVKYHLLWSRYVGLKWEIERAISTPARKVRSRK